MKWFNNYEVTLGMLRIVREVELGKFKLEVVLIEQFARKLEWLLYTYVLCVSTAILLQTN
jgi:hypothetical protein